MNEYSEPAERLKNLFEKIRQNHPDWNDEHILRAILEVLLLPFIAWEYKILFDNLNIVGKTRTEQIQVDVASIVIDSLKTLAPQYSEND